jgi:hypothetical protein
MRFFLLAALLGSALGFSGVKSDAGALSKLTAWLESNKLPPHKVEIGSDGKLVATEDIAAGELMLSVPFKFLISPKTAGDGSLGPALKEIALPNSIVLTLFLIAEKTDPNSFYQPWLSVLPEKVPSSLYFNEEEMAELEGSMMHSITQQRRQVLANEYKEVMQILSVNHSALFPADKFTEEQYTWATSIVASRSITVNAGNVTVPVIVPFADLATHNHMMNTSYDFDADNNFKVVTHTPVNKSQPVQISIGGRSNSQLLLSHGLTLDNNDYDQVQLNVRVSSDDPFESVKKSMLKNQGMGDDTTFVISKLGLSKGLLAAMRIQALRPAEFERYVRAFRGQPVSLRNELEVYRTLVMACQELLKRYKTSYQEDVELLKTELAPNKRNAVIMRKGEKETLLLTIDLVARMWDQFLVQGYDDDM